MASNEEIKIVVTAEDKASGVFNNLSTAGGKLGSALLTIGKVGATAALAGFTALGAGTIASIKSFKESEQVSAQLAAALQSTGNAAGQSIDELERYAQRLQNMSGVSDEAVTATQAMLATFTNIHGETFTKATAAVLDMSVAMNSGAIPSQEEMRSQAIQLGKALNDPINGITALTRVGVTFSDEQKNLIESLVNTGKTAEAQTVILKELEKEFGGSAEAAGNTFAGKMRILSESFDNLKESIGKAAVEALTPFIDKFSDWVASDQGQAKIEGITRGFQNMIEKVQQIPEFIDNIKNKINEWIEAASQNVVVIMIIDTMKRSFDLVWASIRDSLIPAIKDLWEMIEPHLPIIKQGFEIFAKVVGGILLSALLATIQAFAGLNALVVEILALFIRVSKFLIDQAIKDWERLTSVIAGIIGFFERLIETAKRAAAAVGSLNPFSGSATFKIPGFATGGVVPGPMGAPTLAVVHGGETVTPPGKSIGGVSNGISINISGTFLSEDAASRMADLLMDRLKLELRI